MLAWFLIFIGTVSSIETVPTKSDPLEIISVAVTHPSSRAMSIQSHVNTIISFWTDAKLRAAKPIMPNLDINPQTIRKVITTNNDPPVFVNGTFGSLQENTEVATQRNQPTGRLVFGYTGHAAQTTGKIFWTESPTSFGICSGAVVTAENKDTIITAGHCCFNKATNQWRINDSFIFIPNYNSGVEPYGRWAARMMIAYSDWTVNQNYNHDVCFLNLYKNSAEQHIQDVVGSQGIGANYQRNVFTYSLGYPYNLDKGEIMQYCSGTAQPSKYGNSYTGQTIPCDMAGGCSGGPWFQNFNVTTGIGVITSLNSFTLNNIANYMNGPYFDTSIWTLYQQSAVK